jgi:hypothetical protein|tara:strand:- start:1681 stop:1974 length:294 start_codon:yes stop_codon:yes gene_type:complete
MDNQEKTKLYQEQSQANKAKSILENELFQESIDKLKKLYSESLFNTGAAETNTREKLWMAYQIVGKVEQHFKELVETGKLASKQLESFRKDDQQKKF